MVSPWSPYGLADLFESSAHLPFEDCVVTTCQMVVLSMADGLAHQHSYALETVFFKVGFMPTCFHRLAAND